MNGTLWHATNPVEIFSYFFIGFGSLFLHGYTLFICYAVSDYQNEKPSNEKNGYDILIKVRLN